MILVIVAVYSPINYTYLLVRATIHLCNYTLSPRTPGSRISSYILCARQTVNSVIRIISMYRLFKGGGGSSGLSLWKNDFELGVRGEGQDTS